MAFAELRRVFVGDWLLAIAAAVALGFTAYLALRPGAAFIHPDFHDNILQEAVINGPGLQTSDVLNAMQPRAPEEFRPRFVAYGLMTVDQKLRLILHDYVPIPGTFLPIAWLLQLILAPYLLYRLIVNLASDRRAAFAAVVVYGTSIGFLSGLGMLLLQGKVLAGLGYIAALHLTSRIRRNAEAAQLMYEVPGWEKHALVAVMFTSCFLDEMALFVFVLVPVMFPDLFYPRTAASAGSGKPRRILINAGVYALSGIAFLFFVLVITPYVWKTKFGRGFEYLQNALAIGQHTYGAKSMFVGPNGVFGLGQIYDNLMTLFGLSLVPHQISEFVRSPFGAYPGSQVVNLPKLAILAAFVGFVGHVAWSATGPAVVYLRRVLLATALFIVFLCLVMIRQFPIVTGYYYGAPFAVMFALLVGLAVASVRHWRPAWQSATALLVLVISLIQIDNFIPIHAGWRYTHYEIVARPRYEKQFKLSDKAVTGDELRAIRAAWQRGELKRYLAENELSTGAIYLVVELRTIDRFKLAGR
jgi:hypothetical protein